MELLITAGATREPIDDVRFLSNVSTGATGAALAEAFVRRGARVTLLRGIASVRPGEAVEQEIFSSTADLAERLRTRLATGRYDAVLMTAAVSDYRVVHPAAGKISSSPEQLDLRLVRNPKLLPSLKGHAPRPLRVVGFKLTSRAQPAERRAAVAAQFAAGGVDLVVQNDLAEILATSRELHPFAVYTGADAFPVGVEGADALADVLAPMLAAPASAASPAAGVRHRRA